MRKVLKGIYYFLPVQLLLLHFRKYQLLLIFWVILMLTITGNFASHFGASSLFLAPEYLDDISFGSMLLLGGATAVFVMGWHITTFIIHSARIRFMGAARHAFLIYCVNNSLIPLFYLLFYSAMSFHFQQKNEHLKHLYDLVFHQVGFFIGFGLVIFISFAYFFRTGRDLLKVVLAKITNPSVIREFIPYDTLDDELDILQTKTYISSSFSIKRCDELENYHPRLLNTVLRRHHRNAIFATIVAYIILLLLGIFMDEPYLRIPAGASVLIFFSIIMGVVGAMKYFLRSWETIGWIAVILFFGTLVKHSLFDLRSIAYGVNYSVAKNQQAPEYSYDHLKQVFSPERYNADKKTEETRLQNWKNKAADTSGKPPLVVIAISGGGTRAAYWTFRTLQYLDSASGGKLFKSTVIVTGASGGMIGAAYWRGIHDASTQGILKGDPYDHTYQANIGKDILNSIIFSMGSVDLISPFNKISIAGYSYTKDRGYAMEQELIRNTDGLLDKKIGDFKTREAQGEIPEMIINGTIINDGRRIMMAAQPVGYLTRSENSLSDTAHPPIDAIDFAEFFPDQNPYNLRLTSALRMNATFPVVLPVVRLPSNPTINVMDAGLRDNFGAEVATRYLFAMREWLERNTSKVIYLEIRDTREYEVKTSSKENSLAKMLADPMFVIQDKWEAFQSYGIGYLKEYLPFSLGKKMHMVTMQYVPKEIQKTAELNFHLTRMEKEDIVNAINYPENIAAIDTLLKLLH